VCYRVADCNLRVVIREPVLKLEDSRSIRCNSRISHACVRFLEELLIVINSCVLNCECNKLPLRNRTCELITIFDCMCCYNRCHGNAVKGFLVLRDITFMSVFTTLDLLVILDR
jgi:hypothetical protein